MSAMRTAGLAPRLLLDKEIGLSFVGWGAFLISATLYCIIYNQFVDISPATFLSSFVWGLKEYAHWLVITPVLIRLLRYFHQGKYANFILLYAGLMITSLSIALVARTGLDIYLNPHNSFIASMIYFFPAQASVLGFVVIIWELLLGPIKPTDSQSFTHSEDEPVTSLSSETIPFQQDDSVLVMKGNGERLIKWESIDFISAAGNYMELTCATEKYLLRASMKQLEKKLPAGRFIRIHRSYIVNVNAIDRIIAQAAGNGVVALRNEHLLPLSKGYRQALNAYKFVTHSSQ